jgi:hypothetical protein
LVIEVCDVGRVEGCQIVVTKAIVSVPVLQVASPGVFVGNPVVALLQTPRISSTKNGSRSIFLWIRFRTGNLKSRRLAAFEGKAAQPRLIHARISRRLTAAYDKISLY